LGSEMNSGEFKKIIFCNIDVVARSRNCTGVNRIVGNVV
jgi:hypothetical protein